VGDAANAIAPNKRSLSSMAPSFVETPKGVMIIGTPGGSYIISMVLLGTLDYLDGLSAADVVKDPRYHHQYLPDVVDYEKGALSADEIARLQAMGHSLKESSRRWGNMEVITWDYAPAKSRRRRTRVARERDWFTKPLRRQFDEVREKDWFISSLR